MLALHFRISDSLKGVLEEGEWLGITLSGRTPTMAYRDQIISKLKAAIESRFSFEESGVIRATRLLNLNRWPEHTDTTLCEGL